MFSKNSWKCAALCLFGIVVLSGCGSLGSPVSITDRPLAEQMEDRAAGQSSTTLPDVNENDSSLSTPEAIAFSDALASGNFLRLDIDTNGIDTALRTGPGNEYEALASLGDGVEVLATGDQAGEWVYVIYGDLDGWVSNRRLSFGDGTAGPVIVQADEIEESFTVYEVYGNVVGVNIRAGANPKAELVTGAPTGSQVVGTGRTDGSWIEITYNGLTGWSSGNYLRPVGSQASSQD